jgi:tetratricopeptide (TPR) repeat protein
VLTDLSRVPIAETLRGLSSARASGDLEVRSGKVVKTVYFDHGRIVFAASNLKKDRLGEALVSLGRITDEEYARASAFMKQRRKRFGEALVASGVMDRKEVGRSVSRQVKRIVVSLFDFKEGAASFEERKCPIPLEYMVSLSVHRILYMGIKAMKGEELVHVGIGDLDRWVTLAPVPPFPFGVRKCSAEELDVLEQANRKVTIRRLAWEKGGVAFTRLRAVYALLAAGILEYADKPQGKEEPTPVIQMETSTFLLSALRSRPDPSAHEALRQEVNDELQRSSRLDREAWLKVSRTAPRDELVRALEEKMERYHALLEAVGTEEALKTDIELILGRASTMLRLARQAPLVPPAEPPPAPSLDGGASAPAKAPPAPAAPRAAKDPTTAPVLPVVAAATPAPRALAAPPAGVRPTPPPAPAAKPAPAPPEQEEDAAQTAGRANDIQRLIMEGDVRMAVSDYANASKVYGALVDLAPRVPAYRLRLAIAMACWPRTAKQAEREFLEAARLDPNNADLHYQFGLYYKSMKVKSRAIAVLQTAVRLNPQHKQARLELESLSPRDSALTSLRKLFK